MPLRWVGVFQSQLAEIVPPNYRPIRIDRLQQWIESLGQPDEQNASELVESTYVIRLSGDRLINLSSVLSVRQKSAGRLRCDLGPINLAIRRDSLSASDRNFEFESDPNGHLVLTGDPPTDPGNLVDADDKQDPVGEEESADEQSFNDEQSLNDEESLNDEQSPADEKDSDEVAKPSDSDDSQSKARTFEVPWDWSLSGQTEDSETRFSLSLPATLLTTLYLAVPVDQTLDADVGVLQPIESPPKSVVTDAEPGFETTADHRWYRLELGGRRKLQLRTSLLRSKAKAARYVIRRCSVRYQADLSGLLWTQRIDLDVPTVDRLPTLKVEDSTVTSVRLDGVEIPFDRDPNHPSHIRLNPTGFRSSSLPNRDRVLRLSVVGFSGTSAGGQSSRDLSNASRGLRSIALPVARPIGATFLSTTAIDDVQIAVQSGLLLADWRLPPKWHQTLSQTTASGMVHSATGPSLMKDRIDDSENDAAWSTIDLIRRASIIDADAMMRVDAGPEKVRALKRLVFESSAPISEPLLFDVEPSFSVEATRMVLNSRAAIRGSRDEVDIVRRAANGSEMQILVWPTMSDWQLVSPTDASLENEESPASTSPHPDAVWPESDLESKPKYRLTIEFEGSRLRLYPSREVWAPIWFIQRSGSPTKVDVALHPPVGRQWLPNSLSEIQRDPTTNWSTAANRFLRTDLVDVLAITTPNGVIGELKTKDPGVNFDVISDFRIDGSADEMALAYGVTVESAGRSLKPDPY